MSEQDRTSGRAGDGLPQPEQGAAGVADDAQEVSGLVRRFRVAGGERTPRLIINNSSGAVRVRGGEEGNESITLRAVKANGEAVPLDLVADVDLRFDGEIVVKARPFGDVQRQVRRITKSLDFNRADFLDNLGDMIDTLAQMKTAGRNIGQVQLEASVPARCDLEISTASGGIQVQGVTGEIELKSASGRIETRQLGGKLAVRTASGDVRADGVDGTAYLQSVSGEVDARGISGDVVIHTTSGDTRARGITGQLGFKSLSGELAVERSRLNGFYINTTSGECSIDAHLEPGSYEVRTVSGEFSLRVQPDFAGILSGRTVSGAFRCDLPYRYVGDDRPSSLDDDDDRGNVSGDSDDGTEISLPGIKIGKGRVELPGIKIDDRGVGVFGMRIDDNGIDMPGLGVHIGKDRWDRGHWGHRQDRDADREHRRERRRSRNRWEFLIGDPATAETSQTRLRIRSVSGSVTIRQGRGEAMGDTGIAARAAAAAERAAAAAADRIAMAAERAASAATSDRRGWPDSELWPSAPAMPTPPAPPAPPTPPYPAAPPAPPLAAMPPAAPTAPTSPTPPTPPTPSGEARSAAGEADISSSASPVADLTAGAGDSAPATATTDTPADDAPAVAETAPVVPVANPERTRLDILEALERGEISADEALRLLRRLEI